MKKQRYIIFNPIADFYQANPQVGYNGLEQQQGYNTVAHHGMAVLKWHRDKMIELESIGYKHCESATAQTGGDNDYLVIDTLKKEFCFWENGFQPFSGDPKNFPTTRSLDYWSGHRK